MELSKNKIGIYSSLGQVKMRRKYGLFTVEGRKSVEDLLPFFQLEALILLNKEELEYSPFNLSDPDVSEKVYNVSEATMKKLSSLSTPSDVMAVFRLPEYRNGKKSLDPKKLYLMLDGVQDPGNMGTIIRTAHWFGVEKIFTSKDSVDIYNPKTVQATMGSLGRVEVISASLSEIIQDNPHIPVYGTFLEGEDIYKAELTCGGIILMGNEGKGISAQMKSLATRKLFIPPYHPDNHSESLNVAIATAVVLSCFRSRL